MTADPEYPRPMIPLQDHLEARIRSLDQRLTDSIHAVKDSAELQAAALDKAVSKADLATAARFEAVNEFRGQLKDQISTFPTRNEVSLQMADIIRRMDQLSIRMMEYDKATSMNAGQRGRVDVMSIFTALASIAGVVGVIALLLTRHQ